MNFNLSQEQQMLREVVQRYLRAHYGFVQRQSMLAAPLTTVHPHWQRFADFGWLALNIDEAFGGMGCSAIETSVLMESMGAALVTEPIVVSSVLCARILQGCGRADLAEPWLVKLATGEATFALAHAESPGAGSADALRLPGLLARPEGEGFLLQGLKTMVVAAPVAHRLIVSARLQTAGAEELALFVVDPSQPGLHVDGYRLLDGRACADVSFDGVVCAASDRLISGADAQALLDEAMDHARVASMAETLGGIEACLELTAEYIKVRAQFGQTLSKFQALQHQMAEMFVDAQDARSALYRALAHLDAEPSVRRRAVASAQLFIGRAGREVSSKGLQLHGGYGMTDEYRISHHFRQLFVLEKLYGDPTDALERMVWEQQT